MSIFSSQSCVHPALTEAQRVAKFDLEMQCDGVIRRALDIITRQWVRKDDIARYQKLLDDEIKRCADLIDTKALREQPITMDTTLATRNLHIRTLREYPGWSKYQQVLFAEIKD